MSDQQPPPRECQYCGKNLAVEYHKLDCRVVADIESIPLDFPYFLRRKKPPKDVSG